MPAEDDDELLARLGHALVPEARQPDAARVAALRAAAEQRRDDRPPQPMAPPRSQRHLAVLGAAAAVAVIAAITLGVLAVRDDGSSRRAGGVVEFETVMRAPEGGVTADVTGIRTGIGRVVEFRTDELPILPVGEYYEVWFVGPRDSATSPNRISAGTFHPDEQGRTDIELTAAVDPAKYPVLSVTAEPGDGDPGPNGEEVLQATLEVN